ncbi:hypothetical protein [Burkholderia lata]|uniref:Uncharacterized protein n=1 Tax=Burkholderia lata (strain ATCC 17760 / DSM 23089 / LMG 22485 / NCIMB 9086 / R18194 / 383) TaxID=482957 RepID=Q39K63_BURL3|nr:hypothetical protein [Burkholderia lata]ABB07153.1 hypothetical protein Bcep18194_A3551 [Burkholderia lata]
MSDFEFDISVDHAFDRSGGKAVLIKFSAPVVELNVYVSIVDVGKIIHFGRRGSDYALVGESANSSVHWKREDGDVYVLVGEDQEVWDFSIVINDDLLDQVISEIENLP